MVKLAIVMLFQFIFVCCFILYCLYRVNILEAQILNLEARLKRHGERYSHDLTA